MTLQVDREQLAAAYHTVRAELLAERNASGHWVGELSSSPLATATAISALMLAEQGGLSSGLPTYDPDQSQSGVDELYRGDLSELIVQSLHWLAEQQNEDGGWGDTPTSRSNIATTMLVQAAFHLTGVPARYGDLLQRCEEYVNHQGGVSGLRRRYNGDKSFVAPILMNCALADMIPWRKVPSLPFELACLPQRWYHWLNLPVVSYAMPALVAIGQARFHHTSSRNPLKRWVRSAAKRPSLAVLQEMQPENGGFLEATPLTSFVVMSLASMGMADHVVVRRGVEFLLASVRADGSWPVDTNLATWNTSQAITALDWNFSSDREGQADPAPAETEKSLDWLFGCQHRQIHPATGAAPGGWAWTNLPGGIPDADDTAAALLALATWRRRWPDKRTHEVNQAARAGVHWLLGLQNRDGGWPTFCRGWGKLPFDRSGSDLTAHALRALHAWQNLWRLESSNATFAKRVQKAVHQGIDYLKLQQQSDGTWLPLWFGNEFHPQESNPVIGTAKVLLMCDELGLGKSEMARRAVLALVDVQHASGGWGAVLGVAKQGVPVTKPADFLETLASVEETALAVEALLPFCTQSGPVQLATQQGLSWLAEAVLENRHLEPAPIGFYFAKLWYYERLYPKIFATRALACASRTMGVNQTRMSPAHQ